MIFSIRGYRTKLPIPSLHGGMIRHKPVIPIRITGPAGTYPHEILVDTGSDDVVFPIGFAALLRVNLTQAPAGFAQGVGARPARLLYATVILELTDGVETCRWRAVVGFTQAAMQFPLLGVAGGLEHFRTMVDFDDRQVELIPKSSLPSTQDPVP